LFPVWGDAEIANRLTTLVVDYSPQEMIWLGDSLHTIDGCASAEAFLERCAVPTTIVAGNHDSRWARARDCAHVTRDRFFLHHGDRCATPPPGHVEIVGHHHPAVSLRDGAGTRLKLPALVVSPMQIVLPAFSPWAAGTPWRPGADDTVYAISAKRIFTVSPVIHQKGRFVR
jgi:uncharacterized protein